MKTWLSAAFAALVAAFAISLVLVTVTFALAVREQKQGGAGRVDVLGMAAATASCGDDGCTVAAGTGWSAVAGASAVLVLGFCARTAIGRRRRDAPPPAKGPAPSAA